MKPLLVSSGEPAGVGPDLCLALAAYQFPVVILGDINVLEARAKELNISVQLTPYTVGTQLIPQKGQLNVLSIPCPSPVVTGVLNPENGTYVIDLLTAAATFCASNDFSALITAPVHKANINAAGIPFTGHTEFFAQFYRVPQVVMMLACDSMRVALITTHLPLKEIATAITGELITRVITQLHEALIQDFAITDPEIYVAGLNPHAGESGYLGREEIEIITPALNELRHQGIKVHGPYSADTLFATKQLHCDAYVAMYHDQGLPVLKYAGFGQAVNITLGLPIIRTSVDHGTAIELAGTNTINIGSMLMAVRTAQTMVLNRTK